MIGVGASTSLARWIARRRVFPNVVQGCRMIVYSMCSDNRPVLDESTKLVPVLTVGRGTIEIGKAQLGIWPSPHYFSGHVYLEARETSASISIGNSVYINNAAAIISERTAISIGDRTIIGQEFFATDSDFHDIDPRKRMSGSQKCERVAIGRNVFIGARVSVLKGVTIGDNAVVASGSIVVEDVPECVVVAGVPARVVRHIG